MFEVALFTIDKTCKQSKCLLTDEWIKKMCVCVCVCIVVVYSLNCPILLQSQIVDRQAPLSMGFPRQEH